MTTIYIGGDVSKGYADYYLCDSNEVKLASGRFDDNAKGHAALRHLLNEFEADSFVVGVESTGGLENNWLSFFSYSFADRAKVYRLNPLSVKKFLEYRDLHRAVDDAKAAEGIAMFLRANPSGLHPYCQELDEAVRQFRFIKQQQKRLSTLKVQLQCVLVVSHPELVRFARGSIPAWLLDVLKEYPTVDRLAQAKPPALAKIKGLTLRNAQAVISAAQTSVASARGEATETLVRNLAIEISRLVTLDKEWKDDLCQSMDRREIEILCSIPGIGKWTATSLFLEIGDFKRFKSSNALVAFCGLDPRPEKSGDKVKQRGISRRGRSHVRGSLYMPTLAGIKFCPEIQSFYKRLRSKGKPHYLAITACSAKLLRIAYACVLRDSPYVQREAQPKIERKAKPKSVIAPVSLREAKKREHLT